MQEELLRTAILLEPDRFTSLAKTPWAGSAIGRNYKNKCLPATQGQLIGEAWEFSCDPTLPSLVSDGKVSLITFVQNNAKAVFGEAYLKNDPNASVEILVKLLNAAQPLSLQVHPKDGDAALKPDECGKPESWLILDAEPGAGLYLGFAKKMTRDALRELLLDGDAAKKALHFVPVKRGDYFEIEPGVPHAIGPGVTLLEPQRISPSQTGKTYRMWDWGRYYDAAGKLDPMRGKPRELHLDASLRLVDPETQVGDAFVATTRRQAEIKRFAGGTVSLFPANPYYQTSYVELKSGASLPLTLAQGYGALISLRGDYEVVGKSGEKIKVQQGVPALLPFAALPATFAAQEDVELAVITPAKAAPKWGK